MDIGQFAGTATGWSAEWLREALRGNPAFDQVCIRYLGNPEVKRGRDNTFFVHASVVALGKMYRSTEDYRLDKNDLVLIALGDAFGLGIAPLTQQQAEQEYLASVREMIAQFDDCPAYNLEADEAEVPEDPDLEEQGPNVNVIERVGRRIFLPVTFARAFAYVQENLPAFIDQLGVGHQVQYAATAIVSVCKTGTVSKKFAVKVDKDILRDLNVQVTINLKIVERFYATFVRQITPDLAREFFELVLARIPEAALRLRLTIQQAADHGLTSINLVTRAMEMYPDFPWHVINRVRPGEVAKLAQAIALKGDNPYAGFTRNLGDLSASFYKVATYTAKQLLIRVAGESSLKGYMGGEKGPINSIDQIIDAYEQGELEINEDGVISLANLRADQIVMHEVSRAQMRALYAQAFPDRQELLNAQDAIAAREDATRPANP